MEVAAILILGELWKIIELGHHLHFLIACVSGIGVRVVQVDHSTRSVPTLTRTVHTMVPRWIN